MQFLMIASWVGACWVSFCLVYPASLPHEKPYFTSTYLNYIILVIALPIHVLSVVYLEYKVPLIS